MVDIGGNAIEYLEFNIYPELHEALLLLTEHLLKNDEIRRHKERLREQRTKDRMEQKKIEKMKLKEELGSDYESSEDSIADEYYNQQQQKQKDNDSDDSIDYKKKEQVDSEEQKEEKEENVEKKQQKYQENMEKIQENMDEVDEELNDSYENEKRKMQEYLKKKSKTFNPLRFIADQLIQQQSNKLVAKQIDDFIDPIQ